MEISRYYISYFILVGFVFFLFFFILSLFGYFFLLLIKKNIKFKENLKLPSPLEQLFVSFGIGITIYISYSYLLDLFALFNVFTAYFSIIIFDISFIILYFYKNKESYKKKYNKNTIINYFKNVLSDKNNVFYLGILILTLSIISIIQWIIITEATSLNYLDPFKWYADTFYLLDNGHINYLHLDYNYPSGYTIFNAGVLLIYPDYFFGYYYFKFVPLFFICLYIIIALTIIKKLFTMKSLVLLSLLFILTSRYFLSRTLLYLSSSLASGLLIISLIIIIDKYPDYVMGIFVAGIYLIHNLTCFYFIFVLLSFYLYKLTKTLNNFSFFLRQLKSITYLIIIIFILLIPYLLSIYIIFNDTFLDFISHFFMRFEESDYANLLKNIPPFHNGLIKIIFPLEYFEPITDIRLLKLFNELFENSIFLFFIFPFIGLFLYIRPSKNKENKEILIFFKLFIIIIIIFYFLPLFFIELNLFIKFRQRILQSFNLPIIIMTLYTIEWIIIKAKKLTNSLILKFQFYNHIVSSNKFYSKIFKIESIIVIVLMTSVSASFLQHRYPDFHYYYDDELVEVVLYLRTKAEPNSKILREDFDSAIIFRMLYDMKIEIWDLNKTSTYQDILLEIDDEKIDYLIFSKDFFDNETIEDSLCNNRKLKDVLENDDFILFRK